MQCERIRLVADIGGTRTRFALSRSDCALEQTSVVSTADYDSLVDAAQSYLDGLTERSAPVEAVVAVASPVTGDRVELTNCRWGFSIEDTRRELGLERLSVINDVEAVAVALPYMEEGDLMRLGDVRTDEVAPRAVIAAALMTPATELCRPRDIEHLYRQMAGQE